MLRRVLKSVRLFKSNREIFLKEPASPPTVLRTAGAFTAKGGSGSVSGAVLLTAGGVYKNRQAVLLKIGKAVVDSFFNLCYNINNSVL